MKSRVVLLKYLEQAGFSPHGETLCDYIAANPTAFWTVIDQMRGDTELGAGTPKTQAAG